MEGNQHLQRATGDIIGQLTGLIGRIDDDTYARPWTGNPGGSAGRHVRHVIEFYECLFGGLPGCAVSYDRRPRNTRAETDRAYAAGLLDGIRRRVAAPGPDRALVLHMGFGDTGETSVPSTYYRELAYNLEHAIHHMAILKMGLLAHFPGLAIADDFGVAFSTRRHLRETHEHPAAG